MSESDRFCSCGHPESRHDRFGCHYPGCGCRAFDLMGGKCPIGEAGRGLENGNADEDE